jgi:DUF1680 family protein
VTTKTPKGKPLTIDIVTDFPKSGDVKIKVNVNKPEEFMLKLRIPSWSEKTLLVDRNLQLPIPQPGQYAEINRKWQSGDEIRLTFDMRCKLIDAPKGGSTPNSDRYKALRYGPLVLCRNSETDPDYNKPVTVIAGDDGFVYAKQATEIDGLLVFDIPTSEGSIKMYPYAHVNGWNGAKIQTWLPEEIEC